MGTISHIKSNVIADGGNTDVVRPSDWNSVHLYTLQDAVSLSGNTTGTLANINSGTCYLAGGNNITLSQNANSVTVSGRGAVMSIWPPRWGGIASTAVSTMNTGSTATAGGVNTTNYTFSIYMVPLILPYPVAFSAVRIPISNQTVTGTGSVTHVYSAGFYTNNNSTLSLLQDYYGGLFLSQNSQTASTYSLWTISTNTQVSQGNAGAMQGLAVSSISSSQGNFSNQSYLNGLVKHFPIQNGTLTITLGAGHYWYALGFYSMSSNSNIFSQVGILNSNAISSTVLMDLGAQTSATLASLQGWGVATVAYSSSNNAATWFPLPSSVAISDMISTSNSAQLFHYPVLRNM